MWPSTPDVQSLQVLHHLLSGAIRARSREHALMGLKLAIGQLMEICASHTISATNEAERMVEALCVSALHMVLMLADALL